MSLIESNRDTQSNIGKTNPKSPILYRILAVRKRKFSLPIGFKTTQGGELGLVESTSTFELAQETTKANRKFYSMENYGWVAGEQEKCKKAAKMQSQSVVYFEN